MSKLLRNWEEIAKVACKETKYALGVCSDKQALARLAVAFPECFRDGASYESDRFSWQHILRAASRYYSRYHDEASSCPEQRMWDWHYYIREVVLNRADAALAGIPLCATWGNLWYRENGLGPRPPQSVTDQLVLLNGKKLHEPIFLQYEGQRCIVGCIWYEYGGSQPEDGPFYHDPKQDGPHELALVPADVIAFDC